MTVNKSNTTINEDKLKDDFYAAVNDQWLAQTTIPADRAVIGTFDALNEQVKSALIHDFTTPSLKSDVPQFQTIQQFYQLANDFNRREKEGIQPLKILLSKIQRLQSFRDFASCLASFLECGLPLPFTMSVNPDMKDTATYILYLDIPQLILPNKNYYLENNLGSRQSLLTTYTQMAKQLLLQLGYESNTADALITHAERFDALLAQHIKTPEQLYDMNTYYNVLPTDTLIRRFPQLHISEIFKTLFSRIPQWVVTPEPEFFNHLGAFLTEANFPSIKAWMLVKTIVQYSALLNHNFRETGDIYERALTGRQKLISHGQFSLTLSRTYFKQAIGVYYEHRYFTAQARQDVHQMVANIITIYQKRLMQNTWLSPLTRRKALEKLDYLTVNVGAPSQLEPLYQSLKVTPSLSLLENSLQLRRQTNHYLFQRLGTPVDRSAWTLLSGDNVNAYYSPMNNAIFLPAAILQSPFYDVTRSASANYGGIGAIIAHEISHAFDDNGARFDKTGNMHNWWQADDFAHFQTLNQKMVAEFSATKIDGHSINGQLTVTENTADAGGLNCALTAIKNTPHYHLKEFFISWALVWRSKATPEYSKTLLATDQHSPAKARVNIQVQNIDDFYTTFNVHPGDGMYRAPADRVKIW